MRSPFAFLKSLVLPAGRTSGQRIILNGQDGQIDIYDSTNTRILTLNPAVGGLRVMPDTAVFNDQVTVGDDGTGHALVFFGVPSGGVTVGRIDLQTLGAYSTLMRIAAPLDDASGDQGRLLLGSEDVSGGLPPTLRFRDDNGGSAVDVLRIDGGASADLWFDHPNASIPRLSLARGLVATTGQITTSEGPYTADTTSTDLVLNNVPHVAGRTYWFVLGGLCELSAATGSWQCDLLLNGSYIGTFSRPTNQAAALARHGMNGIVEWVAPNTSATDDFAVLFDERTGTADITSVGGATATSPPRFLSCYDVGD